MHVFSKAESDALPPLTSQDFDISFVEGKGPIDLRFSPLYKCSLDELKAIRTYLMDALIKGFVKPS